MELKALQDFELYSKVPEATIKKYSGKIPEQFIEVWKNYGFGSFLQGYFKIINPDEYIEFVRESYFEKNCIPLLVTALGDIIVWERKKYLYLLFYRYNNFDCLDTDGCDFFLDDIADFDFQKNDLKMKDFKEVLESLGYPAYDECYGYVPLLSLGGAERPENLQKVKLREYLELMYQVQGEI